MAIDGEKKIERVIGRFDERSEKNTFLLLSAAVKSLVSLPRRLVILEILSKFNFLPELKVSFSRWGQLIGDSFLWVLCKPDPLQKNKHTTVHKG